MLRPMTGHAQAQKRTDGAVTHRAGFFFSARNATTGRPAVVEGSSRELAQHAGLPPSATAPLPSLNSASLNPQLT